MKTVHNEKVIIIEKLDIKISMYELISIFKEKPFFCIIDKLEYNKSGFSIIAFDPFIVFKSKKDCITIIKNNCEKRLKGNAFLHLRNLFRKYQCGYRHSDIPFVDGCIGYFSYDIGRIIEKIPEAKNDRYDIPDITLGFYNCALVIENTTGNIYITATSSGVEAGKIDNRVNKIKEQINNYKNCGLKTVPADYKSGGLKSNFSKANYMNNVKRAKEYIRNGDVFQVNLSQRFTFNFDGSPLEVFLKLKEINPVPFSAYLDYGDLKVVSSSPERFIKTKERLIETRPIKGTRPRGKNHMEDIKLEKELINSEKDISELTMIIDLERNDLGRICEIGCVKVDEFIRLEKYSTVFHLVSIISGKTKEDKDFIDFLKAAFPGGSITGAPKIRAMEIINELEPESRNIYTGSIGYIGFNGDTDLNIAIRTIVFTAKEAFFNVGGGIVWDSDPEDEYEETLHKGEALFRAISNN